MAVNLEQQRYDLLAYAIDRKGLTPLPENIVDRNYTLAFESFATKRRFNEFDGVIMFQGIFESFGRLRDLRGGRSQGPIYQQNELDKRKKELELLFKKGGFVCFLLCEPFKDRYEGYDLSASDLTKVYLSYKDFYKHNFNSRITNLRVIRDEFLRFFEIYGAANSYFQNLNEQLDLRILAEVGRYIVSIVLWGERFFIPCLLPENDPERIKEFFSLLCDALVSTRKKLLVEIPRWVNEFRFEAESMILEKKGKLLDKIRHIDSTINQYERYKRILMFDNDTLVDSVSEVLEKGFGIKTDTYDDLKEDLKILNKKGKPIIFVEIKGTNRGVKREDINQADSHRERAGLSADFPTILIMNTHIKNSRTLAEKNQDVAVEQIKKANETNVLLLRTYDLLGLLKLHLARKISKKEVLTILTKKSGWLKVIDQELQVVTE